MSVQRLDGPRLAPLNGGPAKQLVILLHGYASDGDDIISLGNQWQRMLPDAAFAAPSAPEFCSNPPMGFEWFDTSSPDPADHWRGVENSTPPLNAFIDTELETHRLDGGALALAGFSQGAIMALHVGLRRNPGPKAIVSFAGTMIGVDRLEQDIAARPEVMLIHGDRDDIIPVDALQYTQVALQQQGIPVRTHIANGIAHGIDGEGTWMAGVFLREIFGFQTPQEMTIG
jgi:phospholipase/carboxylesterase